MVKSTLSKKPPTIAFFIILELVSVGMGMGVPFFTILLGFPVGWFLPGILQTPAEITPASLKSLQTPAEITPASLKSLLRMALITSTFSALIMAAIWLPALSWLFDPAKDLANYGMPLILFEPLVSFIGWIVLMVLISPFLQFLMTMFGSAARLAFPGQQFR